MNLRKEALDLHRKNKGKLEIHSKVKVENGEDLSLAYSPGVAEPCKEIKKNEDLVYEYTNKGNMVAVVSDGSAVLGLGNIGPTAGLPVMEGKAILFKEFAGVDAFPICLNTQDPEEIIETVVRISPSFGGINLEDIKAPECFMVEEALKRKLDIPVFHDDQHGTAIVTLAGVMNSIKLLKKEMKDTTAIINGAGAAGIAIAKLLLKAGIKDLVLCNSKGILNPDDDKLDPVRRDLVRRTNKACKSGTLVEAIKNTDLFIGVSGPSILTKEMLDSMNRPGIVFAMANPVPEVDPSLAKEWGVSIVGTGRSDYPNQVNNVLAFPGIFRGALDARARVINEEMKLAAAYAIANLIKEEDLKEDYIIPHAFDPRVGPAVAEAVRQAAIQTGVHRI